MIEKLKGQVESILREFPEARNNDITLTVELWKKYYPTPTMLHGLSGESIYLKDLYDLPRESNIGRARRLIQSDKRKPVELRYLPTSWAVAHQRKISEELWRQAMANN
jgi:hypothetical protein